MALLKNGIKYETKLVMLFFVAWGFLYLDRQAISMLMPMIIEDIALNNTKIGQINMWQTIGFAISAPIFAILSDRLGHKKQILFWATLITSILALITMFAGSFNYLLIVRTLLGASEGIILPISISMLAAVSRPTTLGRNMGLVYAGAAVIGVAIGPVVVTQLGELFDWRYAFLFVSLPSFIAAMLMLKVVKEVEVSPLAAEASSVTVSSILSGLKNRNILICTLISVFCMGAMWTFNSFLPLYLTQISQLSITQMGIVFSLFGLLTIVWQIFIPYSSDKIGRKPAMTGYLAMAMVTPLVLFIFPNSAASLVILVLFGGIILAMNTIYQSIIPVESVSPLVMASANALIMGVGELIGAFSIGFSGVLADAYSLTAVMLVVPISYFVAFLISFGLIETLRTKTAAKEQALVKATPEI
ncbi:MFS transporter [Planococcus liqunii]|uniref:MFS transporter n=1 Tax=Planococcus liqunii TaxID=3058394 RepID=A0ABT8MWL4_9BACL|nr:MULTISPECIES: MFS transporter [unclassified Planococcus (in: firmicutes)]MDN7229153.1 MFS transporter [Planococcus sp. N064]WKA51570.1 MFS transporter [Planococcus sp. N056]